MEKNYPECEIPMFTGDTALHLKHNFHTKVSNEVKIALNVNNREKWGTCINKFVQ